MVGTLSEFKAAFESSPCGLLIVDKQGTITLTNREIERMFKYSTDELLGKPIEILIPERFRQEHPGHRSSFFANPTPRKIGIGRDLYGLTKDGIEIPVEIGLTPVNTGKGLLVISSIVDISERKRAEFERSKLEAQLRQSQKTEALGQLAGDIAHEFNNILQAILGHAELEKSNNSRKARKDSLDEIIANVHRGKAIVEKMLKFTRNQKLTLTSLDLKKRINHACSLLKLALPENVELNVLTEPGIHQIMGDATSLDQVLISLINNSIHAMPQGGKLDIAIEPFYAHDNFVRLKPELHEGWYVRVMVRDTGKGMDENARKKAFEPFFTTEESGKATGLGLSMVHEIVREHGGTTWINSEADAGTTVNCLFPIAEDEGADFTGDEISVPYGSYQRIMCVDDEGMLQTVNKKVLESLGYKPEIFVDPRKAFESFQSSPDKYDLGLIDYSMPHINGIELTNKLLKIRPDLPVVLASGVIKDTAEEKFRDSGATSWIRKPFTRLELSRLLHSTFNPN